MKGFRWGFVPGRPVRPKKEVIGMKSLWFAIFLIICFAIIGYEGGWAIDYRMFGENEEGIFYYDVEGITRTSKDTVKVWIKETFRGPGAHVLSRALGQHYRNLGHSVSQEELNCKDKTSRHLSLTLYAKDGTILSSKTNMVEEFEPVEPNSVHEKLHKAVCK